MSITTLTSLDLPETPVNVAVDAIIGRARELVDRNGVPLFSDFDRAATTDERADVIGYLNDQYALGL